MRIRHIFVICLFLAAAVVGWAGSEETEYYAVFVDGKKVGHAERSRVVADGKVTTTEKVSMEMSRADIVMVVNTTETCIETTDGKPIGFEAVQDTSLMTMNVSGALDEKGMANVTVTSAGTPQKMTFEWPKSAVMAEGLRLLQQKRGLKEGLEYSASVFSPANLQAIETEIHVGPKRNVDLMGRVTALTEVRSTNKIPGAGEIVSICYVDKDLNVQKSIMPAMGMQIEMIACDREVALSENDVLEMVDKMFVASPEPLRNITSAGSVVYHISLIDREMSLKIPSGDNQRVRQLRTGGAIITVRPVAAPKGAKFPYKGADSEILDAMKPTRFLQSDNNEIIELAKRAVGDTGDAAEAVKKIESFVSEYIKDRSLSIGYASAAEVAASKVGDCSEFAVLTASMCRAVGIPARVVSGLVYVEKFAGAEDVFGGHMWVEAYVGDKWVGLDATRAPKGFDAGHIALAVGNGEPMDFFNLVTTLGQFKIDKVIVHRARP
ncbi:MAG: transglutaminase-like domain-containing protein [Phycisphaerae bacterium]|nr:transglutaminase-like domain-containing protein [Phycisphaerae bacterium]